MLYLTKKGFTLAEVIVAVAILLLLTGIAVPTLLNTRVNANEHYAISNIQTISVAAQTYWSVKNSLPTTLAQLHTEGHIDGELGCASSTCPRNGYNYGMRGAGQSTDFVVYATPQTANDGVRSFCAGSDGVTRVNSSGAAPDSQAECTIWSAL